MTIKLNSLARWAELGPKSGIVFEGSDDGERRVRINFNLEAVTSFFIHQDDEQRFLTTLQPGLETLEFNAVGTFAVFPEENCGCVQYQSADLEPTFSEIIDPVIFTKIANRRHRNPELEEIMYRMQANMERRLSQQAGEFQAALDRRVKEEEHGRPAEIVKSDAPGAAVNAGSAQVPAQVPATEKSGEAVKAAAGSEQPGGESGGKAGSGISA